ncbi:MAG: NADH-quinone oxidoreductase subunit NuoE [Chloroflexi bacterium]|nr:NADH-quinone oxidoreductase subunit NuoE [Chloroflexota bacterium]
MNRILSRFSGGKEELIPILQAMQEEFRYLPEEGMLKVTRFLKLSQSAVYGVGTFYAQFKFTPSGKRVVRVCRGTACHVRGGARVLDEIERRLGIRTGETTQDKEYTLETVACIGACALAPTMTIDGATYGQMSTSKVAEVFGEPGKAC